MKKFLQIAVLALPIVAFSQLKKWDFNDGTTQGWIKANSTSLTGDGANAVLVKSASANPYIYDASTNTVDATANKYLRVNLRNLSTLNKMSFRIPYNGAGVVGADQTATMDIPFNQTASDVFKDYYIDLSTLSGWTGSLSKYAVRFSDGNAATSGVAGSAATPLQINEIEFLPNLNVSNYTFSQYEENWTPVDGTISTSGGILTFVPNGGPFPKIVQNVLTVDGDANKYIHVIYRFTTSSPTHQLRLQYKSAYTDATATTPYGTFFGANITNTTSTDFQEAIFDLSADAKWYGTIKNIQIIPKAIVAAKSTLATEGTLEVDAVIINNTTATLSATEIAKVKSLAVYPNPASDVLNLSKKANKVVVYSTTGQLVKSANATDKVDVSKLNKGNYLVKVQLEDGSEQVVKFIKK